MSRRDVESHALDTADNVALLQAAMGSGRQLAGGITHDLNSALQCLGDALFAIRDDIENATQNGTSSTDASMQLLAPSLRLADDAFHRINNIALTIPSLVPRLGEETGPINLGTELLGLVSLTRHHWRNRVEVSVEVERSVVPFWCTWWVARLAALRLLLSAIESQRTAGGELGRHEFPRVHLHGAQQGQLIELRACAEKRAPDGAQTVVSEDMLDPTLVLCAKRLGGDVRTIVSPSGPLETVFRFPVQRTPPVGHKPSGR